MRHKLIFTLFMVLSFYNAKAQVVSEASPSTLQKEWDLEECIQYALKNNITINQSKIDHLMAQNELTQSRNNRLPTWAANANQHYSSGRRIDPITSDFVNQRINSTTIGTAASITLWNGGYISNSITKSKILVQQNEFFIAQAQNNIILSTIEAYIKALSFNEAIKIAKKTKDNSLIQYEIANGKFKVGSLSGIDLSNYEAQLANDHLSLVNAENSYRAQVLIIKQLLEIPPEVNFDIHKITFGDTKALIPTTNELYRFAESTIPDIKIAKLQREARGIDLKLAKAGYYPKVVLNAGLSTGYTNTQYNRFATQVRNNLSPNVSIDVSIPIFSQFTNRTNVKNAHLAIDRAQFEVVSKEKELYSTIETVIQNTLSARAQADASNAAARAAEMAYELANKKSELGALSPTELIIAKNEYINAAEKHLQAQLMHTLYQKLIEFYQGTLLK